MSFRDLSIQREYRSLIHNVTKDFFIPLLHNAVEYKRAVGFFSSSILVQFSDGLTSLARNHGSIQLVASPYLSEEDVSAIQKGYELRRRVREIILTELKSPKDYFEKMQLNLLANLIADGILDLKIALTNNSSMIGMYHEKMGIFVDSDNNCVAFSGSMNESKNALDSNYEVIDVWCSWKGEEQNQRVKSKKAAFSSIWSNTETNVSIIEFPQLKQELIDRYRISKIRDYVKDSPDQIYEPKPPQIDSKRNIEIPSDLVLYNYQMNAIEQWEKQKYCGIFDMATGTGKTVTGLGAVARLHQRLNGRLAVVIVCPYQHLVEQWVEEVQRFKINPIVGYSTSPQKDWLKRLENSILYQNLNVKNSEFFCFICTNATFSTQKVQEQFDKLADNTLLLVDEAHNFGAHHLSQLLSTKFKYRLALSATIERHRDEEGTSKLYKYFGKKCIEYSLERAIDEMKLTRYKYYPIITTLNQAEMMHYSNLTEEIAKCILETKNGKAYLSEKGKMLTIKRARLVAGIADKIQKLRECIAPYTSDNHILVYCGSATLQVDEQNASFDSEEEIRQIDAVTSLLGNELDMRVSQFTSREKISEREILKREFASGEHLQVLVAIKCLDEGVNIPAIKTAFILASTTNPKEYIQRRGRVLRLYPSKEFAEIYDFLALPRPLVDASSLTKSQMQKELTLVKNELLRAKEFSRLALNMSEANRVLDSIKEAYFIDDFTFYEEEAYVEF